MNFKPRRNTGHDENPINDCMVVVVAHTKICVRSLKHLDFKRQTLSNLSTFLFIS